MAQKSEWKNLGYELYKEWKGEDDFNAKMEQLNKDPPAPGIFSQAQLQFHVTKIKTLFGLAALKTQKRGTHANGFGAFGKIQIVNSPQFPEHEFFTSGKTFPVRLRHSNLSFDDDAKCDFRGAALKLADSDDQSPLDIIMSTGRSAVLWDVNAIYDALNSKISGDFKGYLLTSPQHLFTNIDGIRRPPDSCTDQVYYPQMPSYFKAKDGTPRYVKYRMINADGSPETGRLTQQEQRKVWDRERYPDEKRSKRYLREEYIQRLSKGPIKYKLQLQLHEVSPSDSQQILSAAKQWNDDTHPWMDLADVTITTMLPDDEVERTKYNVANCPPSLGIIGSPKSMYDFTCINYIRKRIYKRSQKMRLLTSPDENEGGMVTYLITVETGDVKHAGTNATISITMTGSKGRTDAIVLDKTFHDDFERGDYEEYQVKAMDVGDLYVIRIHNDGGGSLFKNPDWFVNKVTVLKEGSETPYEFPCYCWVLKDLTVFNGSGLLPQQDQPEIVRITRELQTQQRQQEYHWMSRETFSHFPGCINAAEHDEIPKDSQFSDPSIKSFNTGRIHAGINLGITYLMTLFENWDELDDFKDMYTGWVVEDRPKYAENDVWLEDRVFGMQYLNGVNPMMIQRCDKLPEGFPVTHALVANLLDRGLTLEQELQAGHVYLADYSILEGIRRNGEGTDKVRYVTEPLVLLYVNSAGDLVPIAIQLHTKTSETNPIWTPNDSKLDWMFVKMWAKAADLQVHQMISHLLRTHLTMECFAVSSWRNLPSIHPVFKLLFPHIRSVMAINTLGRKDLINKGGISDVTLSIGGGGHIQLIQKFYKKFTWDMLDVPKDLERRGLTNKEKLPNFLYREDALVLWETIFDFIREIMGVYYHSDNDVLEDKELQAWVKDIHDNGFPSVEDDVDHQFPQRLETRDDVIKVLTCVVFTCSCQHAAVNFGQLEVYSFIPNAPPTMQLPPPTKKGETNMKRIMSTLPSKWQTAWHIGTMHTLTRFAEDEKFLGDYSGGLFVDQDALKAISNFQEKLQKISDSIKSRNETLEWPYTYLLPERVPNSVAI
ncbi:allene oxide synthase-lipoxygenase protein-like [Actinia tenebrosa]|uniref:Allene oxide synthase-lipoxygenase protein-like n=1 Tax=Actinia tenebrosa TaxID=6105 RepID=A0A6P8HMT2_ACTTE|nr:allene oxide synthase-lipoxygenase protein-like [Actinia tenebrosa]